MKGKVFDEKEREEVRESERERMREKMKKVRERDCDSLPNE